MRTDSERLTLSSSESVLGYLIGKFTVKSDTEHLIVGILMSACILFVYRAVGLTHSTVRLESEPLICVEHKGIGRKNCTAGFIGLNDPCHVTLGIVCIIIAYSAFIVNKLLYFSDGIVGRVADLSDVSVFIRIRADNRISENISGYGVLE